MVGHLWQRVRGLPPWQLALWGALIVIAVALRAYHWVADPGILGPENYDGGVYFGSARLLLGGMVPYRDFIFVQPPGITVLMLPFAELARLTSDPIGRAAARVAVLLFAMANMAMVAFLARAVRFDGLRWRWLPPFVAAAAYGVALPSVGSEWVIYLESISVFWCLLALVLLDRDGRVLGVLAGLSLSVAVAVKLFAAAPVLAVLVFLVVQRRWTRLGQVVAGGVLGGLLVIGPFLVLAPLGFVRDVVLAQLQRPAAPASAAAHLVEAFGLVSVPHLISAALVFLLLALAAVAARHSAPVALWLLTTVLVGLGLATAPTFFRHYGAFMTPWLALILAGVTAWALAGDRRRAHAVTAAAVVVATVGSMLGSVPRSLQHLAKPESYAPIAQYVRPGDCVWFDSPNKALSAGLLTPAHVACGTWLDQVGSFLVARLDASSTSSVYERRFSTDPLWQQELRSQLEAADVLLLDVPPRGEWRWSPQAIAYVRTHFRRVLATPGLNGYQLWTRSAGSGQ